MAWKFSTTVRQPCADGRSAKKLYMLDLLFETSWEVCNKVGGIYAVLSTKAKTLQKQYKDKVIFVGPDIWTDDMPSPYFLECKTPLDSWLRSTVLPDGVTARVGRWDVPGKPLVVLVDFQSLFPYKNTIYAEMWRHYGVDSLHAYGDYDEACMFGVAAAIVIESIVACTNAGRVVAHFDEWTTGMGLLHVKSRLPRVATVFTTHATSIGRSISGNGKPLYDYMAGYNGDQMAVELNMQSKHSLEKTAALEADAFTTVSDVTARECRQLIGRDPIVTPNAFEQNFVPRGEKMPKARAAARERLLRVAEALTGETFGDDTLLVATSGRCEFRNKGIDVYLDALNMVRFSLGQLSNTLSRRIVAFTLVPAWVKAPRADLAAAMTNRRQRRRLFNPVITHTLNNEGQDAIYGRINSLGIHNEPTDLLKVIDIPCYLDGNDGIVNLSYYDVLPGLDLTVFPSYYEPWGYTPLESVAFGVPTVTTTLAGFGQWVLDKYGTDAGRSGVKVLPRGDSNYGETVTSIANSIIAIYMAPAAKMRALSKAARATSKEASWDNFIVAYDGAYARALDNAKSRVATIE